ncbi:MAG: hypothetical protein DRP87_13540 [Spirochaetes bacterium]|nr:MAG: hypothetical protein DRP87_13540 [Spirochaetota bacterium]
MENSRRTDFRKKCYAKLLFKDDSIPGYLRDISKQGCRVEILESPPWQPGERKKFVILPEKEIDISPVHGTLEIRWIKKEDFYWTLGSKILSLKDRESLNNYRALLSYYQNLRTDSSSK